MLAGICADKYIFLKIKQNRAQSHGALLYYSNLRGLIWMAVFLSSLLRRMQKKESYIKLAGYFLVFNIIVTGILTIMLYAFSYKKPENEILESSSNMLIQLKSGIDVILGQIDGFLNQVTMDNTVAALWNTVKKRTMKCS